MIKSVTVTNHRGETVTMELKSPEKSGFFIRSITGLDPVKATIGVNDNASTDGSTFSTARIGQRNIVFDLGLMENPSIEATRHSLYKFFPQKMPVEILVETDLRTVRTTGYVESNDAVIFAKTTSANVSILCPDPYFYSKASQVTVFAAVTPLFEFPFQNNHQTNKLIQMGSFNEITTGTINYQGDLPVGLTMYIHATGTVEGLRITNEDTSEVMTINHSFLAALLSSLGGGIKAGDDIVISTEVGKKRVLLQRDGVVYNILNSLDRYADWFKLQKGDNTFVISATTGGLYLQFVVENKIAYGGV
jgi:hypothetical protein